MEVSYKYAVNFGQFNKKKFVIYFPVIMNFKSLALIYSEAILAP